MRASLLLSVMLACAGGAKPSSVTVPPPAPQRVAEKDAGDVDYECVQLHETVDQIMKEARFRWHMGSQSGQGVTHDSWVVIKTTKVHPDRADLEWGPLVDGGAEPAGYPYEATIYFATSEDAGTPEQRARRMLRDLGFLGELSSAVTQFQIDKHLDERGLVDGRVPPKTWALLLAIFKETHDDKTAPAECNE